MRLLATSLGIGIAAMLVTDLAAQEQEKKDVVSVTAKNITLEVPSSWKKRDTTSAMRAAEFEIPGKSGEESAELVVYHFDGGATGGVKANVERWIGQFHEEGRKHEIVGGNSRAGEYVWVTLTGTYKKPEGPPAANQTIDKPNSRVIGVVLIADVDGTDDYYFLKFAGPDALVAAETEAFRAALGIKADAEKSMTLDDIKN